MVLFSSSNDVHRGDPEPREAFDMHRVSRRLGHLRRRVSTSCRHGSCRNPRFMRWRDIAELPNFHRTCLRGLSFLIISDLDRLYLISYMYRHFELRVKPLYLLVRCNIICYRSCSASLRVILHRCLVLGFARHMCKYASSMQKPNNDEPQPQPYWKYLARCK